MTHDRLNSEGSGTQDVGRRISRMSPAAPSVVSVRRAKRKAQVKLAQVKLASLVRWRYGMVMTMIVSPALRGPGWAAGFALLFSGIAALTLAVVWGLQWSGYVPCELCLVQREPFYAAVPLGLLTAVAARAEGRQAHGPQSGSGFVLKGGWRGWTLAGFLLLALLFLVSAALGVFHAGVEWRLWAGPTGCTGPMTSPAAVGDFLKQLETVKVVRCDAAALRVLGLSLAGWNAILSLILCVTACVAARALLLRPDSARPVSADT